MYEALSFCIKVPQTNDLNSANVFLYSSGGWDYKVKVSVGFMSSEALSLACKWQLSLVSLLNVSEFQCSLLLRTPVMLD
jgi:hypothetical protein